MESDTDSNHQGADSAGGAWQDEPDSGDPGGGPLGTLGAWGVRDYRDPDSYWRRRFLILAAGFAVLCGMTWGISALLGPARSTQAGRLPKAAPHGRLPMVPGKGGGELGRSGEVWPASPGACSPAGIVLSLFTSQPRYRLGQRPQFEVYAVSTARGACDLPYGPSVVRVMISRGGHLVWDSAACAARDELPAPGPSRFTRGVPRAATVYWNGQPGTAGCAGPARAGAAGVFAVVATADGQSSPVRTFTMAG